MEKRQIELKKKLLEKTPIKEKEDCSVHEIMTKIAKYRMKNNNQLPQKLKDAEERIRIVYKIDDQKVKSILDDMTEEVALVPTNTKNSFFRRNNNIKRLEAENFKLSKDVELVRKNGLQEYKMTRINRNDPTVIPMQIYNQLEQVDYITEEKNIRKGISRE